MASRRRRLVVIGIVGACLVFAGSVAALMGRKESPAPKPKIRYRFEDVTKKAGIETGYMRTFGSTWGDYDSDGDPDLLVNRHWDPALLYENKGRFDLTPNDLVTPRGYFTADGELTVDRHTCSWGEADGAGSPDLYCTQGANSGAGTGPKQLLLFSGSLLVDRARELGVVDDYGRGRTGNWLDYDSDGDLDLLLTNAPRESHPTKMFRNDRGSFEPVDAGIRASVSDWSTTTWADWDSDGDPDVLVLESREGARGYENRGGRFRPEPIVPSTGDWKGAAWADYDGDGSIDVALVGKRGLVVLRNSGGQFSVAHEKKLQMGRMGAWLDVENDGDLDLFVVQGTPGSFSSQRANVPDFLLVQEKGGFRVVRDESFVGPSRGNGDAVTVADFDGDGRQDVFVTNGHNPSDWTGPSQLLRNASSSGNWIKLDLDGTRWNPWGIGARVKVAGTSLHYWTHVTDGVNYRTQSDVSSVHLGIGDEEAAFITVDWPDGTVDCVSAPSGTVATVTIGESSCSRGMR